MNKGGRPLWVGRNHQLLKNKKMANVNNAIKTKLDILKEMYAEHRVTRYFKECRSVEDKKGFPSEVRWSAFLDFLCDKTSYKVLWKYRLWKKMTKELSDERRNVLDRLIKTCIPKYLAVDMSKVSPPATGKDERESRVIEITPDGNDMASIPDFYFSRLPEKYPSYGKVLSGITGIIILIIGFLIGMLSKSL